MLLRTVLLASALTFAAVLPQFADAATCPSLSLGSRGADVATLQQFLHSSYDDFPAPTGYFGAITQAAVRQWQSEHDIVSSGTPATTGWGVVGPRTSAAMQLCSASPTTPPATSAPSAQSVSNTTRTLSLGMRGDDVIALQQTLISRNLLPDTAATGYFGLLTQAAVRAFQTQQGIVSSGTPNTTGFGVVGPRTRAALSSVAGFGVTTFIPEQPQTPTQTMENTQMLVQTPASCTFNDQAVASGVSVTAYQAGFVATGQTCIQEMRTCEDGVLSGSYQYPKCARATVTQSCANGLNVASYPSCVCPSGQTQSENSCVTATVAVTETDTTPNVSIPTTYQGENLTVRGWFTAPSGQGPFPAIILAHGCNGVSPTVPTSAWQQMNDWATLFREWGYATLIVDSFTARGFPAGICPHGEQVPPIQRAVDLYASAKVIAQNPLVNKQKVAFFGDSHGAGTVSASFETSNQNISATKAALTALGGKVTGAVSLYPGCAIALRSGVTFSGPIFFIAGADDDWAIPTKCKTLTSYPVVSATPVTVPGYGGQAQVIVYPNATHAFDIDAPDRVTANGFHLRYNAAATTDAKRRIRTFLIQAFSPTQSSTGMLSH